jgi:hypothetical protein
MQEILAASNDSPPQGLGLSAEIAPDPDSPSMRRRKLGCGDGCGDGRLSWTDLFAQEFAISFARPSLFFDRPSNRLDNRM